MAVLIRMPELMTGMTEAAIQSWMIEVGDDISPETPLAEIETEKAMVEFAAEQSGTIAELLVQSGESVAVGAPIAILRETGDSDADIESLRPTGGATASHTPSADALPHTEDAEDAPSSATPATPATPAEQDPGHPTAQEHTARRFMSPIVRRLARERGIDLSDVTGTGPDGRIVRRDLETLTTDQPTAAVPAAPQSSASSATTRAGDAHGVELPLTGMRRAIARRLTESKSTVPHFYLTANCRVDSLLELRSQINESASRKISVNDFVVKAAAQALTSVPESNSIWGGDHIRRFDAADIAVAVSTDGGLLTPVVRNVNALSLTALSETIADLAERARAGRLQQHELEGGSFSISNLGMYGVDEFSAILNPPQSGILAVGAAKQQPIVVDGELSVGTVMTVTLSADHRVVDGALGAQWLQAFTQRIENPLSILVG